MEPQDKISPDSFLKKVKHFFLAYNLFVDYHKNNKNCYVPFHWLRTRKSALRTAYLQTFN